MPNHTIALLGNPICGETPLFNPLTDANHYVGNWPGIILDRKEGVYRYGQQTLTVVNLPDIIYAIDPENSGSSVDEAITREYLLSSGAPVVVNIVDDSTLERNPVPDAANPGDGATPDGGSKHGGRRRGTGDADQPSCSGEPSRVSVGAHGSGLKGRTDVPPGA